MARAGSSTPPASRRNPLAPRDNAICIPIPRARKPTDQASERSSLVSYFFLFLLFSSSSSSSSFFFFSPFLLFSFLSATRYAARFRGATRATKSSTPGLMNSMFNVPRPRSFAPWNLLGKPETRPEGEGVIPMHVMGERLNFFPLFSFALSTDSKNLLFSYFLDEKKSFAIFSKRE